MGKFVGTGRSDGLRGGDEADFMAGEGGADRMTGGNGDDRMLGGGGNDHMAGDAGHDVMYGASSLGGRVDMTKIAIAEDVKGKVTFLGESAGYKNALGMYKIAADGTIHGVKVLFANASLKGSGGDLVAGQSSVDVDLKAGERVGFFVAPNAYAQWGMDRLLSDKGGTFKLVDAKGNPGNINGGQELKLVHVDANGRAIDIKTQYGTSIFHSAKGADSGLNGDKFKHVVGDVDVEKGAIKIGFEDLWGGGDKDFDDSVFRFEVGQANAALLAKEATKPAKTTDNDTMAGGDGNDRMFGMSGHDTMDGGAGDDDMWANSGNDVMHGGGGNDHMRGGSGDDRMHDGEGNDNVEGNSGNDWLVAGAGDDRYDGDSGFDTLDFSEARNGVSVDLHAHKARGMGSDHVWGIERVVGSAFDDMLTGDKHANVLEGGQGNDLLRGLGGADRLIGGEGHDTFQWLAKDLLEGGKHRGVDTVADFSKEDVLDLRGVLAGQKSESVDDVLRVKDDGSSSHVLAKVGADWVEVVTLEGFTGMTAGEMLKDGMILA